MHRVHESDPAPWPVFRHRSVAPAHDRCFVTGLWPRPVAGVRHRPMGPGPWPCSSPVR